MAEEDDHPSGWLHWKAMSILAGVYIFWIIFGGVCFHFIETTTETESKTVSTERLETFQNNYTCVGTKELLELIEQVIEDYEQGITISNNSQTGHASNSWDMANSILFSTTIVTTIGYGNIAPATVGGKIFTVFYAIVGIPVFLVCTAQIGYRLSALQSKVNKKFLECCKNKKLSFWLFHICEVMMGIILVMFIPAAVFFSMEDWTYSESVYYTFITLTTIGLGDFVPGWESEKLGTGTTIVYKLFLSLWILIGLAWMASIIANLQESFGSTTEKMDKKVQDTKIGNITPVEHTSKRSMENLRHGEEAKIPE